MRACAPLIALLLLTGCVKSTPTEEDSGTPIFKDALGDAGLGNQDAAGPDSGIAITPDAAAEDAVTPDAIAEDALPEDALPDDALPEDAFLEDALPDDAPSLDADPTDAPAPDALAPDAAAADAAAPDAGACPSPTDACARCLSMQCNPIYCECASQQSCVSLTACVAACLPGDLVCAQLCWAQNPGAISDAFMVDDCARRQCSTVCPSSGAQLDDCDRCQFTRCETEANACLGNASCAALVGCTSLCIPTDTTCLQNCVLQYPQGVAGSQALAACTQQRCAAECP
ncbi:MAG: hypothetical protein IT384_05450 [Deltaproteobacteria bacterium]|nr:hypothetical protein [Deltaproteobacteria bacterium]